MQELINIDCDLIRKMKMDGLSYDADQLLKAWRNNIEDNKHQIKLEIKRQDKKIKSAYGVCISHKCDRPKLSNVKYCHYHNEIIKKSRNKANYKKTNTYLKGYKFTKLKLDRRYYKMIKYDQFNYIIYVTDKGDIDVCI